MQRCSTACSLPAQLLTEAPLSAARRQLLLMLARWLCDNVATNSTARALVQDMHLFLMPTANPDGFEKKARSNM